MATGQTPIYLLPYPLSTDPVDVHGDIFELSDRLEDVIGGLSSLPSQSGNNGKFLTTNGSVASWATVSSYSAPTLGTQSIASGTTYTNINDLTINSTTIPSSVTLVSTSATQTLTNKTLTAPVFISPEERISVSANSATISVDFDAITQGVLFFTNDASGNWTLNVRGNSGTTLNAVLATSDSITIAFLVKQGTTAYYQTALTIDGSAQTVKWQGGTAPSAGNANSIDVYTYTIIKTAANTYTILGSQTKFA